MKKINYSYCVIKWANNNNYITEPKTFTLFNIILRLISNFIICHLFTVVNNIYIFKRNNMAISSKIQ